MSIRKLSLIAGALLLFISCSIPRKEKTNPPMNNYEMDQAWMKVESLEAQGLAKTALIKVQEILTEADRQGLEEHVIKALVYQGKYYLRVEEDGMLQTIRLFEDRIGSAKGAEKAILQSMLAELYDQYLMQHLWVINDRGTVDEEGEDIRDWSVRKLVDKSTELYLNSVTDATLVNIPVDRYQILIDPGKHTESLRNTLFDVLGHRAIDYFRQEKPFLNENPDRHILKEKEWFSSARSFAGMDLSVYANSREMQVLKLFQKLTLENLKPGREAALLDLELERLQFVRNQFVSLNTDQFFEEALKKLQKDYAGNAGVAEVNYHLANLYYEQSLNQADPTSPEKPLLEEAYRLCRSTVERFPESYGAELCQGLLSRIDSKALEVRTEEVNLPGEFLLCQVEYKNIPKIYTRLIALNKRDLARLDQLQTKDVKTFLGEKTALREAAYAFDNIEDKQQHQTEIAIEPLKKGYYALVVSDNDAFDHEKGILKLAVFFVSELAFWHSQEENTHYIYVVDRKTGAPEVDVQVSLYAWNYERRERVKTLVEKLKTGSGGYVSFTNPDQRWFNYSVELEKDGDVLILDNNLYAGWNSGQESSRQRMLFYTDRSLYRPGQVVHFKGILIRENSGRAPEIVPDKKNMEISLYDANRQKLESLTLNTNEFGSLSGSFTLPAGGLSGQFYLASELTRDRQYFQVDQYKRPNFQVEILPSDQDYTLGDTLAMQGVASTFSGVPVAAGKVTYRVIRTSYFPYWNPWARVMPYNRQPLEIANGTLQTDEKGQFEIPVVLLADDLIPKKHNPQFNFQVLVDVSDLTGETHSASKTVQASWMARLVSLEVPLKVHRDSLLNVHISSKNMNGVVQDLRAEMKFIRLKSPEKAFRERFWAEPDSWYYDKEQFHRQFPDYAYKDELNPDSWPAGGFEQEILVQTGKTEHYPMDLAVGTYRVELKYEDRPGEWVELKKYTSVYDDTRLPALELFDLTTRGGQPGDQALIRLQSRENSQNILMEVFEKTKRTQSTWQRPDPMKLIPREIKEENRGNFYVRGTFVYNNRFYTQTETVEVPWSNKELDFEYLSFRDKLQPGSDESWTIRVTGKNKDVVFAEMLASMYDASLDDILGHGWYANLYHLNPYPPGVRYFGFGQNRTRTFTERTWNEWYYPAWQKRYSTLNWFGIERIPGFTIYREDVGVVEAAPPRNAEKMMQARSAEGEMPAAMDQASGNDNVQLEESTEQMGTGVTEGTADSKKPEVFPVRVNLNETVFFMPHLKTDSNGNVLIEFKMNEALTRWRFMGLAHTRDLKIGLTNREVITQKELMIKPNAPRFVRPGDSFEFSAMVSNLTDKPLPTEAFIRIYDAETEKEITDKLLVSDADSQLELGSKGNQVVRWKLRIPEDPPDLLVYRVYSRSGLFTDGEEGYLPVLSNRTLVTESMPMWLNAGEAKEYHFDAMEKFGDAGLKPYRFVLETTANPLWYAIQAMPYIREYAGGNSIQLANALYANALARELIVQNPEIAGVFRKWQQAESPRRDPLASQLEYHPELKNVLLEETPWLLDSKDESAQKRNLALLFEANQVDYDKKQIFSALKDLQKGDGGFSWFKQGYSSGFLTLYVLHNIGRLRDLGIGITGDAGLIQLTGPAIRFIDQMMVERYEKLQEQARKKLLDPEADQLGQMDIFYLYTRSFYPDFPLDDDTRAAVVYFTNQAEKYWLDKGLYLEAMIALVMQKNGNTTSAKAILTSLLERSIVKEETGRYWKQYHGYHWTEFPIETQALLIEALGKSGDFDPEVGQMQLWLLKNKQTNRWKTPKASVAAIQALLMHQPVALTGDKPLRIELGGVRLEAESGLEAGTGYFEKRFEAPEIRPEMADIRIQNTNDHIAWGAAYWQYFQDLDKIERFEDTPLQIGRELFRVTLGPTGEKLESLNSNSAIHPGDKLMVRLRIEVDRPMEYIHLKDQRGAGLEPLVQLSGYQWSGGLSYYQRPEDSGMHFYIEHLPRGVYVIEYPLRAVHSGNFSNGMATIQCLYAPEYSSHSAGDRVEVK